MLVFCPPEVGRQNTGIRKTWKSVCVADLSDKIVLLEVHSGQFRKIV